MSDKKINLEEIISKHITICNGDTIGNSLKQLLLDFGKQLLELAAENTRDFADTSEVKQCVLDTIKQIE